MSKHVGECALCQKRRELKQSHIISKFNYKPLKEADGRFFGITTNPDEPIDILQDGVKERLLCGDCETKRSKWEDYVARKWYHGEFFSHTYPHEVVGLDYANVKLYQLSTLYLASISDDDMFEGVNMPPLRRELLRQMIHDGQPGEPSEFGCVMNVIRNEQLDTRKLLAKATTLDGQAVGGRIYRLVYGGFAWLYLDEIEGNIEPDVLEKMIGKDGTMTLDSVPLIRMSFLTDSFREIIRQGKMDKFI